eukprot:TRINITY_DN31055_c0_g1_i1.p1 TRINITY_DN31055_c0_g1~~TRINITY_DN31055_c0_g1_i1.p1  ORF type:complete len:640 (-),score=117.17 TRINITY_DN31055_c0_g1_i1:116-1975(-)
MGAVRWARLLLGASALHAAWLAAAAQLQRVDIPRMSPWQRYVVDHRVLELLHGTHLDDILKDAPDVARPPSLIFLHDSTQPAADGDLRLNEFRELASSKLPERDRVMIASHDIGLLPQRVWFDIVPERNLTHRFLRPKGVSKLPALVYLPRKCNGWTEWCDPGGPTRIIGGECYVEQCSDWSIIEPDAGGRWVDEVLQKLDMAESIPGLYELMSDKLEQGRFFRSRDTVTTREHLEVLQQPRSLPRFTKLGFKLVKVPDDMQSKILKVYNDNKNDRRNEGWNFWGQTQVNIAERDQWMTTVELGNLRSEIREFLQPRLEKWVGMKLEHTSTYGFREYRDPAALRMHLDRSDVLVVSTTFSVYQEGFNQSDWPLEVLSFDGNQYRIEHPEGTMLYYESATLQHGKPGRLPGGLHAGLFVHFRPVDWASKKYTEFAKRRSGLAARRDEDAARGRHPKQEGWPPQYYTYDSDDETSDLQEGTYLSMHNVCGDASEQRDDEAFERSVLYPPRDPAELGEALMDACKGAGNDNDVRGLLDARADANYRDVNGWSPIHEAARAHKGSTLDLLVARNARMDAKTGRGETALDVAGSSRSAGKDVVDHIKRLMEGAANIETSDKAEL